MYIFLSFLFMQLTILILFDETYFFFFFFFFKICCYFLKYDQVTMCLMQWLAVMDIFLKKKV